MKLTQTSDPVKDTARSAKPRTASRFERELDDPPDAPPSPAEIEQWMRLLLGERRAVAVWIKHAPQKNEAPRHVGGLYGPDKLRRLVKDVLEYSGNSVGVHFGINPLKAERAEQTDNQLRRGFKPPADADIRRLTLLPIDIDPRRAGTIPATDDEKESAEFVTDLVRRHLSSRGWPAPAIVDSGNGFYLLFRIDLPAADRDLVKRVLERLKARFASKAVDVDTTVANPGRVLKVPGTMACKDVSAPDRPHRLSRVVSVPGGGLSAVRRELLEALAEEEGADRAVETPHTGGSAPAEVVENARRYIATMPPAVEGHGGHSATLTVATRIVVGFNIPADDPAAIRLMREYNDRFEPRWDEKDLRRKLQEADRLASEKKEPRGQLRRDRRVPDDKPEEWAPLTGPEFAGEVPDYFRVDERQVLAPLKNFTKISPWHGLTLYHVWRAQRSDALVPDLTARQVYWGDRHPRAWARTLMAYCKGASRPKECRGDCSLYGKGVRHGHVVRDQNRLNASLEEFVLAAVANNADGDGISDDEDDEEAAAPDATPYPADPPELLPAARGYHFMSDQPVFKKQRKLLVAAGTVYQAYLPPLIFGLSPKVGLTRAQVRLMAGLTRELTRVGLRPTGRTGTGTGPSYRRTPSTRADKADIIVEAKVHPSGNGDRRVVCPKLDAGRSYVVYGGNLGSRRGRGYSIISDKATCWLGRAGYLPDEYADNPWPQVKKFFDDLSALRERFELVPVGRHHNRGEWKSLTELRECPSSAAGREWLSECTLRVFAPADYLVRWRYFFAKCLGFRWIPGGEECPFERVAPGDETAGHVRDGVALRKWLDERGWSQEQLAKRLRVSRETVSRHVSGCRNSPKFWRRVRKVARPRG